MTPETFSEHFYIMADAPNGVQKLREMILQLAVQGRLVPQDPKDEPASVLLKKIKAEKEKLIKEGKIRKQKPLPPIDPDEVPYELPDGWKWVRLREITHDLGQKKPDKRFTYIDVTSIDKDRGVVSDDVQILNSDEAPSRARKCVESGSVIYSTVRPYLLNIAIIDLQFTPEPIVSTAFSVLHPFEGILNRYLYQYLRSQPFIDYVNAAMTGMAYPAINDRKMSVGPVPLPPIAEQKRIVAKVDQLMAFCDELEARQQKRAENRITLNSACLNALTSLDSDLAEDAWQRISDNFDLLYDCAENVTALRQAILQLAVQGRLVPQDPKDQPASISLKRIKAEKEELIKDGKIRKQKPLPPIDPDEVPYELPERWEWVRVPQVVGFGKYAIKRGPFGSAIKKAFFVPKGYKVYEQKNAIYNDFSLGNYYIGEDKFRELKAFEVNPNDIIISCSGTVGKLAVAPEWMELGVINQALLKLTLNSDAITNEYFVIMFEAYLMRTDTLSDLQGTAQKNITSVNVLKTIPMPLPPLAEQNCIVAKVDQLMALCDELEAKLKQSQSAAESLMGAVVNELAVA